MRPSAAVEHEAAVLVAHRAKCRIAALLSAKAGGPGARVGGPVGFLTVLRAEPSLVLLGGPGDFRRHKPLLPRVGAHEDTVGAALMWWWRLTSPAPSPASTSHRHPDRRTLRCSTIRLAFPATFLQAGRL